MNLGNGWDLFLMIISTVSGNIYNHRIGYSY